MIGYIYYEAPEEEQNFSTLLEFINASETREEDEEFKNAVDLLFEELERDEPNHFAVRQYKKYKLAAGKTAKSILISCGARLAPFDIKELRDLMEYDELELDTLGEEKTALFVIISDTDATFNFVVSIMYSQLFNLLCDKADDVYNGRLPVHVRMLLDEFANIGQIPQGNISFYYFAVKITAQSDLQGQCRYHRGQLRHYAVSRRKGKDHPKGISRGIGERNH